MSYSSILMIEFPLITKDIQEYRTISTLSNALEQQRKALQSSSLYALIASENRCLLGLIHRFSMKIGKESISSVSMEVP